MRNNQRIPRPGNVHDVDQWVFSGLLGRCDARERSSMAAQDMLYVITGTQRGLCQAFCCLCRTCVPTESVSSEKNVDVKKLKLHLDSQHSGGSICRCCNKASKDQLYISSLMNKRSQRPSESRWNVHMHMSRVQHETVLTCCVCCPF